MTDDQQPVVPDREPGFVRSRVQSFGHAFRGWWYVIRTQRNAWIHTVIALTVIIVAFWVRLGGRDWAVLVLTIATVFAAEFLNTAIEVVVDLASPQMHPLAKIAKDVGAATVLLTALAAVIIGLLILGPPVWARLVPYLIRR
jgi:diacylglycerol kinase (ATP)